MNKRFKNYDPSRPDLWEDHNRPWDFDHLLAQYQVSYNQGKFREVCYQWLDCIGNLQVVSFEENRSWQADKTDTKLKDPEEIKLALFENPEEIKKFSLDRDDINDGAKVADFISAARDRLLRIYSAWFKDLDVAYLYHDVTQEISNEPEQRERRFNFEV